jgi:hypothetical protein
MTGPHSTFSRLLDAERSVSVLEDSRERAQRALVSHLARRISSIRGKEGK